MENGTTQYNENKNDRYQMFKSSISLPAVLSDLAMSYEYHIDGIFDKTLVFDKNIFSIKSLPNNHFMIEFCDEDNRPVICDESGEIIQELSVDGMWNSAECVKYDHMVISYSTNEHVDTDYNIVDIWDTKTWKKLWSFTIRGQVIECIDIFYESNKLWILIGTDRGPVNIELYVYDFQSCVKVMDYFFNRDYPIHLHGLRLINPNKIAVITCIGGSPYFDAINILSLEDGSDKYQLHEYNCFDFFSSGKHLWGCRILNEETYVIFGEQSNTDPQIYTKQGYIGILDLKTMIVTNEIILDFPVVTGMCVSDDHFFCLTNTLINNTQDYQTINLLTNEIEIIGSFERNINERVKLVKMSGYQICSFLKDQKVLIYDPVLNYSFQFPVPDKDNEIKMVTRYGDKIAYVVGKEIKIYK
jgi:hypothetical protein